MVTTNLGFFASTSVVLKKEGKKLTMNQVVSANLIVSDLWLYGLLDTYHKARGLSVVQVEQKK